MAHSGESDPFANVPMEVREKVFDDLHDLGLEGAALDEEWRRRLRWAAVMPAADAAMTEIRRANAARYAGYTPDTDQQPVVPNALIQAIDDLDQRSHFTD